MLFGPPYLRSVRVGVYSCLDCEVLLGGLRGYSGRRVGWPCGTLYTHSYDCVNVVIETTCIIVLCVSIQRMSAFLALQLATPHQ